MTEKEKAIEWLKACKETNYRHSPTIQGYMDMAISALSENKGEGRPKGEWDIFGFPSTEDIRQCNEDFICSNCKDFVVNRRMKALCNFCPNCGADMRGKAE